MFRITIGAGLIKARGGSCWREGTCLWYHFETQPVPNPISHILHFLPKSVLSFGINIDFISQLYCSWFVLIPIRYIYLAGGIMQTGFMLMIAASGNLGFLT
eukprot:UN12662